MTPRPSIGRVVIYRSRTGTYSMPALISATVDTLHRPNVDAGHVPDLTSGRHVHLTVFTPGILGQRSASTDPELGKANPPAGGSLQEWDIAEWEPRLDQAGDAFAAGDYTAQPPGTWAWPPRI